MRDHVNTREDDEHHMRRNGQSPEQRLTDREVPLDGMTVSAMMQAMLDGELGEESALDDGMTERELRFWRRVQAESTERRNISAPTGFAASVMSAIARGETS